MSANPPKIERATCVVGCKLPHGLIMRLFTKPVKEGEKPKEIARHTVKGMNDARIVGGYGLTEGVPTEFMMKWLEDNAKHPAVVNRSIFIQSDMKNAEAAAKDGREIHTGLEAINPLHSGTQKRFKIDMDKEGEAAYRKQLAENPVRNRQQVE